MSRPLNLPADLAARPRDRRGLPIPPVNVHAGGVDFTVINAATGVRLAAARCCSLCGQPMARLVGFLGGPNAAEVGAYADPPGHEACLRAACWLCPHIRYRRHTRRTDRPGRSNRSDQRSRPDRRSTPGQPAGSSRSDRARQPAGDLPPLFTDDKPDAYLLVLARGFRIVAHPASGHPLYLPDPYVSTTRFDYDPDDLLVIPPPRRHERRR